jgi:hypothetical protein
LIFTQTPKIFDCKFSSLWKERLARFGQPKTPAMKARPAEYVLIALAMVAIVIGPELWQQGVFG